MAPTPEQQAVIEHGTDPARLLAGPGTGKSYTLSQRVAALIAAVDDVVVFGPEQHHRLKG
jgi:superfamily I DNA/RNA helicase